MHQSYFLTCGKRWDERDVTGTSACPCTENVLLLNIKGYWTYLFKDVCIKSIQRIQSCCLHYCVVTNGIIKKDTGIK